MRRRNVDLREIYFPGAGELVFNAKKAGFTPLPIIYRKLIRYLTDPEFKILTYLISRIGPEGMCYPPGDEMRYELNFKVKKNLDKHLNGLAANKFIERASSEDGKLYFLVYDPRVPIQHLVSTGAISQKALVDINALLALLKQEPIVSTFPTPAPASVQEENAEPAARAETVSNGSPAPESVSKEGQDTPAGQVPTCSHCEDRVQLEGKGFCKFCEKGQKARRREYNEVIASLRELEREREAKRQADQQSQSVASSDEPVTEQKPNPATTDKREQSTNTTHFASFYRCDTCRDKGRIEGKGHCPDCREGESWRLREEGMLKSLMDDVARHEKSQNGRMVSCGEISISFDGPGRRSA
ncbi:MAG: hypothetical protein ACJ746_00610 [Bryobacteraceae bacterium]